VAIKVSSAQFVVPDYLIMEYVKASR